MRRKAKDREGFWYEFPTYPCPGDTREYFWDDDNKEWVYITDDYDMSWWLDYLSGKDVEIGSKVTPGDGKFSGKQWKELFNIKIKGNTWEEQKAYMKKMGWLKPAKENEPLNGENQ